MLAKIVQIGGSKGVRIPKAVLEQCGLTYEVNMKVDKKRLVIEAVRNKPRQGWRESFRANKKPLENSEKPMSFQNKFDQEEWEW